MPRLALLIVLLFLGPFGGALAASERALDLLDARVPYTANFTLIHGKEAFGGQVWHVPGKERREFATAAGPQALIVRRDLDVVHLLAPSGKWYVTFRLSAVGMLAGGLDAMTVDRRRHREEKVGGLAATRWKVKAGGGGGGFDGDLWTSREGVVLKASGILGSRAKARPVEMALSNLTVGKVDPAVFEVPPGWLGMDLRGVPAERIEQAVEGLRAMLPGRAAHQ